MGVAFAVGKVLKMLTASEADSLCWPDSKSRGFSNDALTMELTILFP